jgi:asparaginyl-tRNA synthetase
MKKDPHDLRVTESVDLLIPGVGEIAGGSMRMEGYCMRNCWRRIIERVSRLRNIIGTLIFESKSDFTVLLKPNADLNRYGASHGGYGLGLERFIAWLCKQHTIRTCCLYPRFMGRCRP